MPGRHRRPGRRRDQQSLFRTSRCTAVPSSSFQVPSRSATLASATINARIFPNAAVEAGGQPTNGKSVVTLLVDIRSPSSLARAW